MRRGIAELGPERVLYISCSPATLARDAADFVRRGFALARCTPFDMIPQSDAVETLAVFERGEAPAARLLAENAVFLAVEKSAH